VKVAFCGLGKMGVPMAARLLDAGHEVTVWNRTSGRAGELVEHGAAEAASPAEAATGAEAVITMLADPPAVAAVVAGVAETITAGATLVEMSTIGPAAVRSLAAALPEGVDVLDAPVLGSVPPGNGRDAQNLRRRRHRRVRALPISPGTDGDAPSSGPAGRRCGDEAGG
jgi:3-hydroxyisobutyrate dehydrogenase-like beta-hydroxyacid dehydrogenase